MASAPEKLDIVADDTEADFAPVADGGGLTARIERLIGPLVDSMGFDLWRVQIAGGRRPVLQIMAEPLDGTAMTVEHCAELSRAISAVLDVEDPIGGAYQLEISSPGLDRPLIKPAHFARYPGYEARVELQHPVDGRKRFTGLLAGLADDAVLMTDETGAEWRLPLRDVAKAKLLLTDRLIAEGLPGENRDTTLETE